MGLRNTKIKAESEESGRSSNAAAVVLVQQTGDIFKLDIDCFEEVFDFLPLRDLVSVEKTCKRLQGVARYCFQQNYGAIDKAVICDGVHVFKHMRDNVDCFIPFINRIFFDSEASLESFRRKQSKFVRLKQMTFLGLYITSKQIDCVIDKLNKVEVLQIVYCVIERVLHGMLLNFCINLRRLIITKTHNFDHGWMLNSYPKLEYFEYLPTSNYALNQLSSRKGSVILLQFNQPYYVGSLRMLLGNCLYDSSKYSFCIETSLNKTDWEMVIDNRNEALTGWQEFDFVPRPVVFMKITGTEKDINFICTYFECPRNPQKPRFAFSSIESQ